jgi:hypothetical protein
MPQLNELYTPPPELTLGTRVNKRVPESDQRRQRAEVVDILGRLRTQPGVILADEVGMGKTFVALAIAYSVAVRSPRGPAIIMVPPNLVDKWEQDFEAFCELYLEDRRAVKLGAVTQKALRAKTSVRYGVARHGVELMKLLDDPPNTRCHLIFLAQGAMSRRQSDKWVRLALIGEALRVHGRGKASRLIQVKDQIHRFLAELISAIGEERATDLGPNLWRKLLQTSPAVWKDTYNGAVQEDRRLPDDPVPKMVVRALARTNLKPLATALEQMPIRARGSDTRISERVTAARQALRQIEEKLWSELLAQARWRSPLLVMDEAHHLKNPHTSLARQLQSPDSLQDLRTGDGAMASAFDRMLFLTATPFQLGHHELISVLSRFGDVKWDVQTFGSRDLFLDRRTRLSSALDESQRAAIAFQRAWSRLRPEDCQGDVQAWWNVLHTSDPSTLGARQRSIVDCYVVAKQHRDRAEDALRPWIVRHNKGTYWEETNILRRQREDGAAIAGQGLGNGLVIPPAQLLPFFLAARSTSDHSQDLLSEALCSSYQAFRFTRKHHDAGKDEENPLPAVRSDLSHSRWYLGEFDRALAHCTGATHPKVAATVKMVADLWEAEEKVLVFAFYRRTCRALRIHISEEIERRIMAAGASELRRVGRDGGRTAVEDLLDRVQRRFFDDTDSPGRRMLDRELDKIIARRAERLDAAQVTTDQRKELSDVMRRFLRVASTLVRCFPIGELDSISPEEAVARMLKKSDRSGVSWQQKFDGFIEFLTEGCSSEERKLFLEAAQRTQTGGIRVEDEEDYEEDVDNDPQPQSGRVTLANVQVAMGTTRRDTRSRLMRAFNTPFFPDILVCSEVMSEGVDLQRYCRYIIHHDLAWNPSTIEQRTGRIDRLGCKAAGRHSIVTYLPYLAGTADERQYRIMSEREQWFRVVMGQEEVERLIMPDSDTPIRLPESIAEDLSFKLGLELSRR